MRRQLSEDEVIHRFDNELKSHQLFGVFKRKFTKFKVVGGFPRDLIRAALGGPPINSERIDLDIETTHIDINALETQINNLFAADPEVKVTKAIAFPVVTVKKGKEKLEIKLEHSGNAIDEDFTVNKFKIAFDSGRCVVEGSRESYEDLCDSRLRTPVDAEESFKHDPVRILRAVDFCARGYVFSEDISKAICSLVKYKDNVFSRMHNKNLVEHNLSKMFVGENPGRCISLLFETKLIQMIIPSIGEYDKTAIDQAASNIEKLKSQGDFIVLPDLEKEAVVLAILYFNLFSNLKDSRSFNEYFYTKIIWDKEFINIKARELMRSYFFDYFGGVTPDRVRLSSNAVTVLNSILKKDELKTLEEVDSLESRRDSDSRRTSTDSNNSDDSEKVEDEPFEDDISESGEAVDLKTFHNEMDILLMVLEKEEKLTDERRSEIAVRIGALKAAKKQGSKKIGEKSDSKSSQSKLEMQPTKSDTKEKSRVATSLPLISSSKSNVTQPLQTRASVKRVRKNRFSRIEPQTKKESPLSEVTQTEVIVLTEREKYYPEALLSREKRRKALSFGPASMFCIILACILAACLPKNVNDEQGNPYPQLQVFIMMFSVLVYIFTLTDKCLASIVDKRKGLGPKSDPEFIGMQHLVTSSALVGGGMMLSGGGEQAASILPRLSQYVGGVMIGSGALACCQLVYNGLTKSKPAIIYDRNVVLFKLNELQLTKRHAKFYEVIFFFLLTYMFFSFENKPEMILPKMIWICFFSAFSTLAIAAYDHVFARHHKPVGQSKQISKSSLLNQSANTLHPPHVMQSIHK